MPLTQRRKKELLKAFAKKYHCVSCALGREDEGAHHTRDGNCTMCALAGSPTPSPEERRYKSAVARSGKSRRKAKRSRRKAKKGGNKYKRRTSRRN
jgi:hypothetical protein